MLAEECAEGVEEWEKVVGMACGRRIESWRKECGDYEAVDIIGRRL